MGDSSPATATKGVAKDSAPSKDIKFVVTGFGPFQNVTNNPTSIMSEKLTDYLKNHKDPAVQSLESRTTTTVLEVSAEAVKTYIDTLAKEETTKTTVLLHMGVNYIGKGFQLEQCAYNDATFRIPDEKGYQPKKECVVSGLEWATTLKTTLNIKELCEKLHQKYPGSDIPVEAEQESKEEKKEGEGSNKRQKLDPEGTKESRKDENGAEHEAAKKKETNPIRIFPSTDPGRYVCNYTYAYSLNKFCCSPTEDKEKAAADGNQVYSLFLHVPPFKIIPEEEQLKFVVELMQLIEQEVQKA